MTGYFMGPALYRERRIRWQGLLWGWTLNPDRRQLIHKGRKP